MSISCFFGLHTDEVVKTYVSNGLLTVIQNQGKGEMRNIPDNPKVLLDKVTTVVQCKRCGKVRHIVS